MKTSKISDISLLILRASLGIIIAAHGAQKLLGWFGGFGFDASMAFFTNTIGLPYVLSLLIILAESIGMIALALGLFSRVFAASLIAIMLGAILTTHGEYFFMNWFNAQPSEGFEFHILVILLSLVVVLNGGGSYSLDAVIHAKISTKRKLAALFY
ncbi:DoxX family protein [Pseudochryseolinea flava]|uniref:DoxX family protein n=1 Tax=Pseudochryseolinea flava TaxID=2059302 RepID=A0A364Y955_9BACT|nr:DoxX family protein [Pseudochryseolinea flava]RAW02899.1 hypothetical protein DQQ10_01975 [Pseudochryseolinea flava]